jgi:hypothetical protein
MDADAKLNCRAASRLMSLACERSLDLGELTALKAHLDKCLMCTNFQVQLNFLHKAASAFREG